MASRAVHTPLVERIVPVTGSALRVPLQVLLGTAFLALLAQVRFEIGPVPVTGQTLGVLLIGAAYGMRLGGATLLAYFLAGGLGLSVFSAGAAGWSTFTGTTGGYLLGFLPAAMLVGYLSERGWDRSYPSMALSMLFGNVVIYAAGLAWLSTLAPDFRTTLQWGLWPFLAGDVVKLLVAVALLPTAWKLLGRRTR